MLGFHFSLRPMDVTCWAPASSTGCCSSNCSRNPCRTKRRHRRHKSQMPSSLTPRATFPRVLLGRERDVPRHKDISVSLQPEECPSPARVVLFSGQNKQNTSLLSDEILSATPPQHTTQDKGFIKSDVSTLYTQLRLPV